jgi:hypothetical protein
MICNVEKTRADDSGYEHYKRQIDNLILVDTGFHGPPGRKINPQQKGNSQEKAVGPDESYA